MFTNILPQFIFVLIAASLSLYFLPGKTLAEFISGKNIYISILIAALLGSIAFMPGFIVYPLSGILLSKGVPYAVLSAFTVALMNVGVLTLPIEKKYFGFKLSVIRNTYFFFVSIIIALTTGLFYGEL
jgi:uncharacterized membrane protein YraQ (UPF0718 family)